MAGKDTISSLGGELVAAFSVAVSEKAAAVPVLGVYSVVGNDFTISLTFDKAIKAGSLVTSDWSADLFWAEMHVGFITSVTANGTTTVAITGTRGDQSAAPNAQVSYENIANRLVDEDDLPVATFENFALFKV